MANPCRYGQIEILSILWEKDSNKIVLSRSDYMKCACMGCTEATGRSWDCHTRCDGYKEFQAKNEEEKNVIKRKKPYYKSLSKEKFMKRNALNRNRRRRK